MACMFTRLYKRFEVKYTSTDISMHLQFSITSCTRKYGFEYGFYSRTRFLHFPSLDSLTCLHVREQRLKHEVDHMTRLSQRKEGENAIITETLHSTIVRLEEVKGQLASGATDGMDAEAKYIRENLGLKKEVPYLF